MATFRVGGFTRPCKVGPAQITGADGPPSRRVFGRIPFRSPLSMTKCSRTQQRVYWFLIAFCICSPGRLFFVFRFSAFSRDRPGGGNMLNVNKRQKKKGNKFLIIPSVAILAQVFLSRAYFALHPVGCLALIESGSSSSRVQIR
jgi:hypothetical protein